MHSQEVSTIVLIITAIVISCVCSTVVMCLIQRHYYKQIKKLLSDYDKFERHILQPPIRQSTIMDLNYFSENQSVNIPIEKSDTIYTEEDERTSKSATNSKNVCFRESPDRVHTMHYSQETESEDEPGVPFKLAQSETTSSDSDEANPYDYRSCYYYNNVNTNPRIQSPLKPLADILKKKYASQRSSLSTCREEDSDSSTYSKNLNHQKISTGQVDRYSNKSVLHTKTKLKINGIDANNGQYSIKHQTSYQNLSRQTKSTRGMKRSQSWDPNNKDLQLN